MPVIIEPAVYDPVNDEWVKVVRNAETGEVIGTNTRKTPFDQPETGEIIGKNERYPEPEVVE